ncbi:hypothetical protein BDV41DRAFT_549744 [Aspergillus transmontanensis]|uniref:Uncharacterized protein n=1 Tax=Aspergillus transmontanensis TaxID=1034304 RepID=A0A5N6VLB0_9EURO|nr:hypothetical protein BDV41DRAFT_549744 [Aspergillus transmontanensis]
MQILTCHLLQETETDSFSCHCLILILPFPGGLKFSGTLMANLMIMIMIIRIYGN